jgi:tryptophanyl-tRNA synthetase
MLVALGINPKTSPIFLQSQISAHSELSCILENFVTVGQLNRMTQFKEKSDRHGQLTGLLTYPVLMAADVALYQAEVVPVGEDQVQHLELSREIIRSYNSFVGKDVLVEPKPLLTKAARIMALNDPSKKMSKSIAGSAIGLLATEAEVTQTIKRAVTDSDPNSNELSAGVKNLFTILEGVSTPETLALFEEMQKNGKLRYSELKEQLIEDILAFLAPVQKAYKSLRADEADLLKIIENGRSLAEPVAVETLKAVKKAVGLVG